MNAAAEKKNDAKEGHALPCAERPAAPTRNAPTPPQNADLPLRAADQKNKLTKGTRT